MCKKITAKRKSPRGNSPEDRDTATYIALDADETAALNMIMTARGYPDRETMISALVRRGLMKQEPFDGLDEASPTKTGDPSDVMDPDRMPHRGNHASYHEQIDGQIRRS